jgi:glycosyltransferase involved in cell wall biosynthesis
MNQSNKHYTVAAVIPAYNCQNYIERCIDSVLTQTRLPDEIIVVNDGSTDNTADILEKYTDKITVITQPNAGEGAARNTGIKSAKSDFIAFLDSDDQWLPEHIQTQMNILENNPNIVWTTGNFIKRQSIPNSQSPNYPVKKLKTILDSKNSFDSYFTAFVNHAYGHVNTMVISRKVILDAGLFREGLKIGADIDMWLRIAYKHPRVGFNPEPMAIYYIDIPNSAMRQQKPIEIFIDFINRHISLSRQHNMFDQFKPVAAFIVKRWIRGFLFSARGKDIKLLIKTCPELHSPTYRFIINILATFPKTTARTCHSISYITRKLKLRKELTTPPTKIQNYNNRV